MFIVLVNRNAGWTRDQRLDRLLARLQRSLGADGQVLATGHAGEVRAALAKLDPARITALVPVGGDGTLSGVLTAACACWGADALPPMLPLRAGTMNMVALDVRQGRREAPLDTLARVLRAHRAGRAPCFTERALLQSGCGRAGFVAGLGMPTRFLAHYDARGGGFRQALASILRYSGSVALRGELARELFAPVDVTLTVDDGPARTLPLSLLLAMSVDTLPLGFRVGTATAQAGMTLLHGQPDPVRLIASLPLIHRGHLPAALGVERLTCRRLALDFAQPQPWQLDGDILPATTRLTLDAGARVRLLV